MIRPINSLENAHLYTSSYSLHLVTLRYCTEPSPVKTHLIASNRQFDNLVC